MSIQLRDAQKQMAVQNAGRAALIKEMEVSKAEIVKLQSAVQAGSLKIVQLEKEQAAALHRIQQQAVADKTKLEAAQNHYGKDAAVQKALADGWARDLKELQIQLTAEQERSNSLRDELQSMVQNKDGDRHDQQLVLARSIATFEQANRNLRAQLNSRDAELKKLKVESASVQKSLENKIEKLQRECDESAAEIQRLRNGDTLRLPALLTRGPCSLHDDLGNLKRMVENSALGRSLASQSADKTLIPVSARNVAFTGARHPTR